MKNLTTVNRYFRGSYLSLSFFIAFLCCGSSTQAQCLSHATLFVNPTHCSSANCYNQDCSGKCKTCTITKPCMSDCNTQPINIADTWSCAGAWLFRECNIKSNSTFFDNRIN